MANTCHAIDLRSGKHILMKDVITLTDLIKIEINF